MWPLNDSNSTNTYGTNDFYTPEDYPLTATQWEFSDHEIDLATVLMNLKEDDGSAEPYIYHPVTADSNAEHQQHQHHHSHHHHSQHNNQHGSPHEQHDSQHNQYDSQHHNQLQHQHHHNHHQQQHQQSWHTPASAEEEHQVQLQPRVLAEYNSLDSHCDYVVHSAASDQNYLLPKILDDEFYKTNSLIEKKRAGRPRGSKPKRSKAEPKLSRIWEFIRDLLLNSQYCPTYICWENYEEGRFRFVQSDKVAKLWGKFKRNERMNYEKFSRAMRYYYKTGVLLPVQGKRLVYKFGPKATGWQTDNPNFKYTSY